MRKPGEVLISLSVRKYAVQAEEARKANAVRKSDALTVPMIVGNSSGGKESSM
jgi:hypothetical protein